MGAEIVAPGRNAVCFFLSFLQNGRLSILSNKTRHNQMNRYEQRRRKLLQNKEVAAGYREIAAELELMHAIDDVRK